MQQPVPGMNIWVFIKANQLSFMNADTIVYQNRGRASMSQFSTLDTPENLKKACSKIEPRHKVQISIRELMRSPPEDYLKVINEYRKPCSEETTTSIQVRILYQYTLT